MWQGYGLAFPHVLMYNLVHVAVRAGNDTLQRPDALDFEAISTTANHTLKLLRLFS
jgi:hypothetical protein